MTKPSFLRGSRDFHIADDYAHFVQEMVDKRNRLVKGKLEQELACLRPLPPAPVPEYADWVEVCYKGHLVERMERVHGAGEVNVNYRYVIGSLVRKPGAFARYRFREQLFPTMHFRLAYDALKEWRGERADVEYVRILHLAATTMEATVGSVLSLLLETG